MARITLDRIAPLTYHRIDAARELALILNRADEEGWTYTVEVTSDDRAIIRVSDEDGEHVGWL